MPPLICPSPVILDHSFPDSAETLRQVLAALGNLQEQRERGSLLLIASPVFQTFVADMEWAKVQQFPQLRDIHRFLTALFLQPNTSYILFETDNLPDGGEHPLPSGCAVTVVSELWRTEVGKIRALHDTIAQGNPFIGIACHKGFAGNTKGTYTDPTAPSLPLVGLADFENLASAIAWEIDPNIANRSIRLRDAQRNMHLLNGQISDDAVGSHYTVHFPGAARPWVLDVNHDPLVEQFVKEICPLIGKPLTYIMHVLIHGEVPRSSLRLH